MTNFAPLVRDSGVLRGLVPASTDVLEMDAYDYAGSMSFGANATAIDFGKVGILTTVKGDFQVDGATTLVSASTLEGDVDLGNGDGDIITLGGAYVSAVDVVYIGTAHASGDTDVSLRVDMSVDQDKSIIFDRTADSEAVLILPDSKDAPADLAQGAVRVNAAGDLEWYDGGAWQAATASPGNGLDDAYNVGSKITVDAAGGDLSFLITGGAADKFRIADGGESDYLDFECTVASQLTLTGVIQSLSLTAAGSIDLTTSEASTTAITLDASAGGMLITPTGAYSCVFNTEDCTGTSDGVIIQDTSGVARYFKFLHEGVATASIYTLITDLDHQILNDETHTIAGTGSFTAADFDFTTTASGFTIDAAKGFSIDGVYDSNVSITDTSASNRTLTVSASNAGAGRGDLAITASDDLAISGSSLDLDSTGAGGVTIDSTVGFSIDGVESSNITITDNSASNRTLTISAANAGAGRGSISIDADDDLSFLCNTGSMLLTDNGFTITGSGTRADHVVTISNPSALFLAMNITGVGSRAVGGIDGIHQFVTLAQTTTSTTQRASLICEALTAFGSNSTDELISTVQAKRDTNTGGDVKVTIGATNEHASATGDTLVDIDSENSGTGAASTYLKSTISNALSAAQSSVYIQATNAGSGSGVLDIDADDYIYIDTAAFSIDGTGVSNVSVTGANLTVSTVTAGALTLTSAAAATWSTVAGILTVRGDDGLVLDSTDGEITFDDINRATSTYSTAMKFAETAGEWDTFEIKFGEVSLLNAISQASVASSTLQESYDAGSGTIALDASGDFQIELDNATGDVFTVLSSTGGADAFTLTSTGADAMSLQADVTTFDVNASGAVSLDAAAASNFATSAGALTLTSAAAATWSTAAGILSLTGAGGIALATAGNTDISLTPNGTGKIDLAGSQLVKRTEVDAATYSTLGSDYIIGVVYTDTGTCTITLSSADVAVGRVFHIIDEYGGAGTYTITIDTQGAETISGEASQVIDSDHNSISVYSDGTNWFVF